MEAASPDQSVQAAASAVPLPRAASRAALRAPVLALASAGVLFGAASLLPLRPALVWNFSPSVPVGLYHIDRAPPAAGDILAIDTSSGPAAILVSSGWLPEGHVLLKPLAGGGGDTVCRHGATVTINGEPAARAREPDQSARLPVWSGCRRLGADQHFVIAPHAASIDSRYFGPVPASAVLGVARPLLTFDSTGRAR